MIDFENLNSDLSDVELIISRSYDELIQSLVSELFTSTPEKGNDDRSHSECVYSYGIGWCRERIAENAGIGKNKKRNGDFG